jgi:hypothetical protein
MGHVLVTANQYVKYEDFVITSLEDNKRKPIIPDFKR